MIRVLILFLFSLSYSLELDDPITGDQLLVLGYQRIKTLMRISHNPFNFSFCWDHSIWPEDVVEELYKTVTIKGGKINWTKRRNNHTDSIECDLFHIIINVTEFRS